MNKRSSNKTNVGLIIGFVMTMVAVVAVGVTLVFVLISQNSSSNGSSSRNGISSAVNNKRNDMSRKNDLARIVTAINYYQSNNAGKTPWADGSTDTNFVYRYVDKKCTAKSPDFADDNCGDEFRDPDGKPYFFVYGGKVTTGKTVALSKDHGIYVYTSALCGENDNEVEVSDSARGIALFYKLSDGSIYCIDNS